MEQDLINSSRWVDILGPPPPESNLFIIWSVSITALIIVTLLIVIFWQRQPAQSARRRIHRLHNNISSRGASNRQILLELRKILCKKYMVSHLSDIDSADIRWPDYVQRLTSACYKPLPPDKKQTAWLLKQAILFIKPAS